MKKVAKKKVAEKAKTVKKPVGKGQVAELKRVMIKLRRESNAKLREVESKVKDYQEEVAALKADLQKTEQELSASRKRLSQREEELNQLRLELEEKDSRLASRNLEMESFKKAAEERICQMEAKIKELETGGQQASGSF